MAFTLPALPYAFDALEPHIDSTTMQIHHDKHHQAYVDNLNKAIAGTANEGKTLEELVKTAGTISPAVRNNGGGVFSGKVLPEQAARDPLPVYWQRILKKPLVHLMHLRKSLMRQE
jgi:superoxide dismutase